MTEDDGKPTYWYIKDSGAKDRYHRFGWRKENAIKKYGYIEGDTEWSIMQRNGWDRVWDCGKSRWVYYINQS